MATAPTKKKGNPRQQARIHVLVAIPLERSENARGMETGIGRKGELN